MTTTIISGGIPSAYIEEDLFVKTVDYELIVAKGDVPSHVVHHIIGRGSDGYITTSSYSILANALVTQPSANTAMKIVSTSAQDDSAGTGAKEVVIEYLTSDWVEKTETIVLDGTTPVELVNTDVYRINGLYVNKIGGTTSGVVGTVTLVDTATGLIKYAQIDPGTAFFERAVYYVPTGQRAIVTEGLFSSSTVGGVVIRIFITVEDDAGNLVPTAQYSAELASNTQFFSFNLPVSNPLGTRIALGIAVKGLTSNQSCTGTLRFFTENI